MDQIAELERRISVALRRIGAGLDALPSAQPVPAAGELQDGTGTEPTASARDMARLQEALDEERILTSQLQERIRALREKEAAQTMPLQSEVDRLTRLLDVQGLEMQRLKKTVSSLREQLRAMAEAQAEGRVEPHLINKAMLTELEALRAQRSAEAAELDEIIAALDPLAATAVKEETDA